MNGCELVRPDVVAACGADYGSGSGARRCLLVLRGGQRSQVLEPLPGQPQHCTLWVAMRASVGLGGGGQRVHVGGVGERVGNGICVLGVMSLVSGPTRDKQRRRSAVTGLSTPHRTRPHSTGGLASFGPPAQRTGHRVPYVRWRGYTLHSCTTAAQEPSHHGLLEV